MSADGSERIGIIACESIYSELARIPVRGEIAFLPPWLHESPINCPQGDRIRKELTSTLHGLERRDVDRIRILYHAPEGIAGIGSSNVPLEVSRAGDCVDLFLSHRPRNRYGERKADRTLYLTRGLIDCGIDAYKLAQAYSGELAALRRQFASYERSVEHARVTWPESGMLRTPLARRGVNAEDDLRAIVSPLVREYDRVVLLDTGTLHAFHYRYAASVRDFLTRMRHSDDEQPVALSIRRGSLDALEDLASPTALDNGRIEEVEPNAAIDREPQTPLGRHDGRESGSTTPVTPGANQ